MAAPVIDQSRRAGVVRTASDVNVPGAGNVAAVLTYAAVAGKAHVLDSVTFGYDGTPTAGMLTVSDAGVTVFSVPVTAGGPGPIEFVPPIRGTTNAAMVVTLAAGGGSVKGQISAAHRLEPGA